MVKWARNENPIPAPRPLSDDENFPSAITSINEEGRYGKSGVKEAEAIQAKRRRPIRTYKGKGKARAASSSSAGELSDSENRGADSDEYPGMKEAISESLATTRCEWYCYWLSSVDRSHSTSQLNLPSSSRLHSLQAPLRLRHLSMSMIWMTVWTYRRPSPLLSNLQHLRYMCLPAPASWIWVLLMTLLTQMRSLLHSMTSASDIVWRIQRHFIWTIFSFTIEFTLSRIYSPFISWPIALLNYFTAAVEFLCCSIFNTNTYGPLLASINVHSSQYVLALLQ